MKFLSAFWMEPDVTPSHGHAWKYLLVEKFFPFHLR